MGGSTVKPGDKMPDGTIYAGISPDTYQPMYTTPADAPGFFEHADTERYARKFSGHHGYEDWRVPTRSELNVLFNNRAAIGGFNNTESLPAGWYWSCERRDRKLSWAQRFSDGHEGSIAKNYDAALRLVR